jgi:hypothetical protein
MNSYAMTFPGKRNFLLFRLQRMINGRNKNITSMEKIILIFCTALIGFFTFSFSPTNHPDNQQIANATKNYFQPANFIVKHIEENKNKKTILSDKKYELNKKAMISNSNKAKQDQSKKLMIDTVPQGASKEFMDGYNAAINYKNGEIKRKIELSAIQTTEMKDKTTKENFSEQDKAAIFKQTEERLRKNN